MSIALMVASIVIDGAELSMVLMLLSMLGIVALVRCFLRALLPYGFMALAGCVIAVVAIKHFQQIYIHPIPGGDFELIGEVVSAPLQRGESTRFDFEATKGVAKDGFSGRVRLSWYDAPALQAGQRWSLVVRLREPHGFASAGAFDYEAWLAREGIHGVGYVRDATLLGESEYWGYRFQQLKQRLKHWLVTELSEAVSGVFSALLLGDKSGVPSDLWDLYNRTGTTHLLVISGLHIGLMAWLGFNLASLLAISGMLPLKRIPLIWFKSFFGIGLAMIYALLAGFSIPVQRALVMTVVALLSCCFGLRASLITLWVFALTIVLMLDTLAFTSVGFWYSFIAVAALCIGLSGRPGIPSKWQRILKPQWLVFVVLLPLLLTNGQSVSLLSPLVNLIAIPVVGVMIVPSLLLAGGLFIFVPDIATQIIHFSGALLEFLHQFLQWIDHWRLLIPPRPTVQTAEMVLAMLGVLLLILPAALRLRWLSVFMLLPLIFTRERIPEYGVAEISVLDVGQGLAVVIRTNQHVMVYDTGDRFSESFTAADSVMIPLLNRLGVRTLDKVMISHGDRDHAGGVGALIQRYGEFDLIAGSELPAYNNKARACGKGETWNWDGVEFQILSGGNQRRSNDASCVLKVTADDKSMLLPGDISHRIERQLMDESYEWLKSDVLLAAHHGSRYSSGDGFLAAVKPEAVIFSTGFANRFNHPSPETVSRAVAAGANTFNTAEDGTLSFHLSTDSLIISAYRKTHDRYWWR
ncbi:DNA internalization-related competence protein ComEC/Rec2 [Endozoicomonas ascidiicola]|uniref:DNA internalization-related competence protein ComEC/Rec2 n=1 Tax=Endozoicomonas ascidiicola TaxID=1698521 RepID=UPI00082F6898|nr:DNA internalization-related competence protein ComEC/Rec2 [Endozoicomonas ascidiicola]